MIHRESRGAMTEKEKLHPTPPKRKKVSLRNICDVKRVLAATINELRRDEVTPLVAGKIFYGLTVMLTVFEQFDMAAQIQELERKAGVNQWQR
jgi:hypothetical protein